MKKLFLLAVLVLCLVPVASAQECDNTVIILDEFVPPIRPGEQVDFQFQGSGGTPPYKYSVYEGTFPGTIHLTPNGKLHGTAPAEETTVPVLILITDKNGCSRGQVFEINIVNF